MTVPLRYPGLLGTVPMAEHLAVGVSPRGSAQRTYLEVEPNHCTLHMAVNVAQGQIGDPRRIFPVGGIPQEFWPAASEHESVLTSAGGIYVAVDGDGGVQTSTGQPNLTAFTWLVGKIRYTRRTV